MTCEVEVVGAVLAGGQSRRMGTDKAFLDIDGVPMVVRCVQALRDAGASTVVVVGGDRRRLEELGLTAVADRDPGQGPLGGLISALGSAPPHSVMVVLACDLRSPSASAITAVVDALAADPEVDAAVPIHDDVAQWLHAAWRPERARPALVEAFTRGERAVWRAASAIDRVSVDVVVAGAFDDVDEPGDLRSSRPTSGHTN